MTHEHKFTTMTDAKAFALAGKAILTLQSVKTGNHFTYKVSASKDGAVHFVSVLANGSADEGQFNYVGIIGKDGQYRWTAKAKAAQDAPSVKAFAFFWGAAEIHPSLIVRHENRCGKCGKTLTHPESIDLGIGPECAKKMAGVDKKTQEYYNLCALRGWM